MPKIHKILNFKTVKSNGVVEAHCWRDSKSKVRSLTKELCNVAATFQTAYAHPRQNAVPP